MNKVRLSLAIVSLLLLSLWGRFTLAAISPFIHSPQLDQKIAQQLDTYLNTQAKANKFSGAVLLAWQGKPFFIKAYGLASREFQVKNNVNTRFKLGSLSKLFTIVAIAQLAQQDKFSLDVPVNTYLSGWLPPGNTNSITVRQLLNHTSGLGSFFEDARFKLGDDSSLYINVNDYKPLIQAEKLHFKPGSQAFYSNSAYIVLGALIEKVSGENYFDYINQHIFQPADMLQSGYFAMDQPTPNLAIGYIPHALAGKISWQNNLYKSTFKGSPAGDAYSTVYDLLNFVNALQKQQLLHENYTQKLLSIQAAKPTLQGYPFNDFGFQINLFPQVVGHGGEAEGVSTALQLYPVEGYTVIVLANIDNGKNNVMKKLAAISPLFTDKAI